MRLPGGFKLDLTILTLLAMVTVVAFALAGCATQATTQSGFLNDYDALRPTSTEPDMLKARVAVQRAQAADLARYRAVYLEPASVTAAGLDPEQRSTLARELDAALVTEFAKAWTIAQAASKETLRVRTAVTAVTKANVLLNIVMTAGAVPLSNGGAAGEAEIVDPSGRRVAALTWADEKRLSSPLGYYAETGHARALMPDFAAEIAKLAAR